MKKTTLILLIIATISLSSCKRSMESWSRSIQSSDRNYEIEYYSGGKLIKYYKFKGILNSQANSEGYYFSVEDTLIEISGDILVKSY